MFEFLSPGLGIDLGTANTVVVRLDQGVILNQPSFMLTKADESEELIAWGRDAREVTGRTSSKVTSVRPLQDGVIIDLEIARVFLKAIISRCPRQPWEFLPPRVVIGIPGAATKIEQRTLVEAAEEAGIGWVRLIPEPIAGALGSGIDPMDTRAHMVVDIGGGTAEVAAFSFGNMLVHRAAKIAGDEMTEAVYNWLRQKKGLIVGELTAEEIKIRLREVALTAKSVTIGAPEGEEEAVIVAAPRKRSTRASRPAPRVRIPRGGRLIVHGCSSSTGRPKTLNLSVAEVSTALKPTVESIIATLQSCLDDLPPQAVSDIMEEGVLAFGGGSLLHGLDHRLSKAFDCRVRVANDPLICVGQGAALCLSRPDVLAAYGIKL